MRSAIIAISVAKTKQLFFISSVMITHFGKNPVKGGRPPKDNKTREIIVSIAGVLFHKSEIELMLIELLSIRAINIGIVSRI